MKSAGFVVFICALFSGCNVSSQNERRAGGSLCIPDKYAVEIPVASGSEGIFDSHDGGYRFSLFFDAPEVARAIDRYQTEIDIAGGVKQQPLYVMLSESSYFNQSINDLDLSLPLDEHKQLLREASDAFAWEVIEKSGGGIRHWGTCVDQFSGNGSYDCQRILLLDGVVLIYPIDQANVRLYQDVDNFLRAKIDLWRCDKGKGQVDFH